ncbi:MAG: iron-containing alcohol dehydrogenase [Deltaproteobacteria bacterium]|nr:iron-containing alcohol dehydrogenase [Deltaproteobacteria bacterium]
MTTPKTPRPPATYQFPPDNGYYTYDLTRPEMRRVFNDQREQFPLRASFQISPFLVGWGAYKMVGEKAKEAGIKHAFMTTTGLKSTGIIDEICSVLKQSGVAVTVYDKVTSNPKDVEAYDALEAFQAAGCDGVVSVGGGTSHDIGKAVRILASLKKAGDSRKLRDFCMMINPPPVGRAPLPDTSWIPQICVNTTTGTGAQFVNGGPITDTEWQYKMIFIYPGNIYLGIDDPLLHRTQPPHILAACGIDSIVHALEGLVSRLTNPFTIGTGLAGIKLMADNLREAVGNPQNDKALENCVWAQIICTHSYCNGAGVGMIHGLAHQISAMGPGSAHHGLTNAIFMVSVCRYNLTANPERLKDVGLAMGMDHLKHLTPVKAAELAIDELEKLRNECGLTDVSLKQFDWFMKDPDGYIDHAVDWAYEDYCREGNPRQVTKADIARLYREQIF